MGLFLLSERDLAVPLAGWEVLDLGRMEGDERLEGEADRALEKVLNCPHAEFLK